MSNICVQYTVSGVGLQSVVLSDLYPDEEYVVQVRCGAQQNFWKWGNWSKPFSFKTNIFGMGSICGISLFSILSVFVSKSREIYILVVDNQYVVYSNYH